MNQLFISRLLLALLFFTAAPIKQRVHGMLRWLFTGNEEPPAKRTKGNGVEKTAKDDPKDTKGKFADNNATGEKAREEKVAPVVPGQADGKRKRDRDDSAGNEKVSAEEGQPAEKKQKDWLNDLLRERTNREAAFQELLAKFEVTEAAPVPAAAVRPQEGDAQAEFAALLAKFEVTEATPDSSAAATPPIPALCLQDTTREEGEQKTQFAKLLQKFIDDETE